MKITRAIALPLGAFVACAIAAPGGDEDRQLESAVKALADAQVRVLGRAAAFCTANRQPENRSLDTSLNSYVEAFSSGTKAAMIEITKTDSDFVKSAPPYQGRDLEVMDQQAQQLLRKMQSSPASECRGLGNFLDSGTPASFKKRTFQSHRDYEAKRAEYCAQKPKPKNCD